MDEFWSVVLCQAVNRIFCYSPCHIRAGCPNPNVTRGMVFLPAGTHLAEAVAAVDRFIAAGLERDFRCLAALGASGREHLAGCSEAAGAGAFRFPRSAALGAALRLVSVALRFEELLVFSGED